MTLMLSNSIRRDIVSKSEMPVEVVTQFALDGTVASDNIERTPIDGDATQNEMHIDHSRAITEKHSLQTHPREPAGQESTDVRDTVGVQTDTQTQPQIEIERTISDKRDNADTHSPIGTSPPTKQQEQQCEGASPILQPTASQAETDGDTLDTGCSSVETVLSVCVDVNWSTALVTNTNMGEANTHEMSDTPHATQEVGSVPEISVNVNTAEQKTSAETAVEQTNIDTTLTNNDNKDEAEAVVKETDNNTVVPLMNINETTHDTTSVPAIETTSTQQSSLDSALNTGLVESNADEPIVDDVKHTTAGEGASDSVEATKDSKKEVEAELHTDETGDKSIRQRDDSKPVDTLNAKGLRPNSEEARNDDEAGESLGNTSSMSVMTTVSTDEANTFKVNKTAKLGPNIEATRKARERETKWAFMLKNWEKYSNCKKYPKKYEKLRQRMYKGIPDSMRTTFWSKCLMVDAQKKENLGVYTAYTKSLADSKDISQIDLDINRTFRDHIMFKNRYCIKQQHLFNVLVSYSLHNPEVGYCQGMAGIVAVLLMYMGEEEAFWGLDVLFRNSKYDMHNLYTPGFPRLIEQWALFEEYLQGLEPKLWHHF
ncbi:hypothetical protein SARC_10923, partial [Sphaeroforma arctica JP610]